MTRQSRSLPGFLAVAFLLLALPSFAAWTQERKVDLPQDEQKLLEYAQTHMNSGNWRESDRAYKAFLDKFPDSKNAEQVYVQLGNLHHWYSNQYAASREWYLKACEKFPKSPNYWNYRFQAAQTWQNQNLKEKALEEYRKIAKEAPDANVRTNAIQQAWNVEGKYFYMHVNQSYTTGQEPLVHVQLAKVDKILFRAEHIKFDAILERLGTAGTANLQEAISKVPKEGYAERLIHFGDWRAMMLKGCDRLDNLRSLDAASPAFRAKQVNETRKVYYAIFNRMVEITPAEHAKSASSLRDEIVKVTESVVL